MTWPIILGLLFGNADPYSAIGNAGVGPYAEERENVGAVAMIFIHPEASVENLERKVLTKEGSAILEGSFSVADWSHYPSAIAKPTGPFRILEGAEYEAARKAANKANQAIRKSNPELYKGLEIHEIHPVKFGGSATDPANKIAIPRDYHRQVVTPWWNNNMRSIKKIP